MTAVKAPAKVLVTGATGYIAVWIIKFLLERGYSVRGTVRSESKGLHLKKQFASYGDKLELVNVADIAQVSVHRSPLLREMTWLKPVLSAKLV